MTENVCMLVPNRKGVAGEVSEGGVSEGEVREGEVREGEVTMGKGKEEKKREKKGGGRGKSSFQCTIVTPPI